MSEYIFKHLIDTSDATATAEDIASGKTAYVNGSKVTGIASIAEVKSVAKSSSGSTLELPGISGHDFAAIASYPSGSYTNSDGISSIFKAGTDFYCINLKNLIKLNLTVTGDKVSGSTFLGGTNVTWQYVIF